MFITSSSYKEKRPIKYLKRFQNSTNSIKENFFFARQEKFSFFLGQLFLLFFMIQFACADVPLLLVSTHTVEFIFISLSDYKKCPFLGGGEMNI
jgi:hypothetical protein